MLDVKSVLEKELEDLLSGKSNPKKSKMVCALSAQIIYAKRLDVEKEINSAKIRYWNKDKKK